MPYELTATHGGFELKLQVSLRLTKREREILSSDICRNILVKQLEEYVKKFRKETRRLGFKIVDMPELPKKLSHGPHT